MTKSRALRKSSLKRSGSSSFKRKPTKGEQIVDFQLTSESLGRSSINRDTTFLRDTLLKSQKSLSLIDDDRCINHDQFLDFALTQQTLNISVKVGQ